MIESICEPSEILNENQPDQNQAGQEFLHQENVCLRAIIADLLIKNQKLRWVVQSHPQMIAGS